MVETPTNSGSQYPTLMRNYETDEDLDEYVIDHAYMFTVIQIRPGGFVSGYGSNYTRTEFHVADYEGVQRDALSAAIIRAEEIYAETKKPLLIYAVANFAGAMGFNRPVRKIPVATFRSKADQRRDDLRARKLRQIERERTRELQGKGKKERPVPKLKAQVFKTKFEEKPEPVQETGITEEEFAATDVPMARLLRT